MPMFFSTVEVKGHIFRGKIGKSKKQAELNAAKVAYSFLNERKSLVCRREFTDKCIVWEYVFVF